MKKSIIAIIVLAVVAVVCSQLLIYIDKKQSQNAGSSGNVALGAIPPYFIDSKAQNLTSYTQTPSSDFSLSPKQQLDYAVHYQVVGPQREVVKNIVSQMQSNKWFAISGSSQTDKQTVIKMAKDTTNMFITFTGGTGDNPVTTVSIVTTKIKSIIQK